MYASTLFANATSRTNLPAAPPTLTRTHACGSGPGGVGMRWGGGGRAPPRLRLGEGRGAAELLAAWGAGRAGPTPAPVRVAVDVDAVGHPAPAPRVLALEAAPPVRVREPDEEKLGLPQQEDRLRVAGREGGGPVADQLEEALDGEKFARVLAEGDEEPQPPPRAARRRAGLVRQPHQEERVAVARLATLFDRDAAGVLLFKESHLPAECAVQVVRMEWARPSRDGRAGISRSRARSSLPLHNNTALRKDREIPLVHCKRVAGSAFLLKASTVWYAASVG